MRFATVAALVSGGAAAVLPAAGNKHLDRRTPTTITFIPLPSLSACAGYTTMTQTSALLTVTATVYDTITAGAVTSTEATSAEPTPQSTITVIDVKRRKRRGDSCKRRSSSSSHISASSASASASASETSSSTASSASSADFSAVTSATASASGPICTTTVTAAVQETTTTVTIAGSIPVTTSATELMTTATSTTEDVATTMSATEDATATPSETAAPPASTTLTFLIKAISGSVANQYLRVVPGETSSDIKDSNTLAFHPARKSATTFSLDESPFSRNGRLYPAFDPDRSVTFSSGRLNSQAFVLASGDSNGEQTSASCRLVDDETVGSTGSFICPNEAFLGVNESLFAVNGDGRLFFKAPGDTDVDLETIELEYIILTGDPPATPVVVAPPAPERTPSFILSVAGGAFDGQVLHVTDFSRYYDPALQFTANVSDATPLIIRPVGGSLVPASLAANSSDYAVYYTVAPQIGAGGIAIKTPEAAQSRNGQLALCQLDGSSAVGSTGSFSCSNGGNVLHLFANVFGQLNFTREATADYKPPPQVQPVTLRYTVVS
ncbi:hypothetical protein PG996_011968 [Apiospora saccharicola]|uniref:Uncharacterized protein n=1 Tax=Apiospora saccharicola TaxID=335842 RepID=A0ABR1U1A9_9PEZI